MLCIGLMSGTSLDGCDCALVEIDEKENFKLVDFICDPYDEEFRERIRKNLSDNTAKLSEICSLNFELPQRFKETIDKILAKNNLKYDDISFIASHGQTIWHNPHGLNGLCPSTLQIGDGQILSVLTGITTVFNFRNADIVVGGEGAPLVPMFEYMFFKNLEKNIILQNIGGMGNLTYLRKDGSIDDVVAFDTGPGNVMIDYYMKKYFNLDYDENGNHAKSGMIINSILDYLKEDEYIKMAPPKSTGREKYSSTYLDQLASKLNFDLYDKNDIIRTITEFTVYSIVYNYRKFIPCFDLVIISGGGSHNSYIMQRLNEELDDKVIDLEKCGLNSDAKEAFAFAVLGYLTLNNRSGNVKKATGAKEDVILGEVSFAKVVK